MNNNITERYYCVWLTLIKGVGPVNAHKLIQQYTSAKIIYENRNQIKFLRDKDLENPWEEANKIIDNCDARYIDIITYDDDLYSEEWKDFVDFPLVLFTKGNISMVNSKCVGIIGARRCSKSGKTKTIELVDKELINNKTIVSGMAKGIDSYAHTATLKNNGNTIAVLGNGVDICYPSEHRNLYEAILENGLVISEYPPGIIPRRYYFPKRNRIIAGLSDKIYVIEAGKNSGTASTIEAANKYGKIVERIDCHENEE